MGIKELWPFLNPYCERKPLFELQGKVVAIDLAGWICESLCVVDYEVQAKFYLRNLFFRTCYLLLSGITPVFVLEGTAPVLKHQTISQRNQIQFRGAKPRKNDQPTQSKSTQSTQQSQSKGRTRFNFVLKQCEELIRSMGLQCVQGPGEAEAFCAQMNACGMVDGVISQDSDCFAYGARRVFRNFTLSMQGSAGSIGGSVDIYDLSVVQKTVDFGRNKIVVMALLCGCDYCPDGVGGVGRDAVLKLFAIYSEAEILDKIRLWRKNDTRFTELEIKVDDKKLCTNCGHYGRVQSHTKSGCVSCKMHVGCDSSLWKEKRMAVKSELQIRKKAMLIEDFPSEEIIEEFLQEPTGLSSLQLDWSQPNIIKFIRMMGKTLQWNEVYCFQKFLPLLTRWQLHHLSDGSTTVPQHGSITPDFIKKKRTPKGVPSFEIIWKDKRKQLSSLLCDDQLEAYFQTSKEKDQTEAEQVLWSTIEPVDLVEKAYPELVERFLESKIKGKAKKNKKATENASDTNEPTKAKRKGKRRVEAGNDDDEPTSNVDSGASKKSRQKQTVPKTTKRDNLKTIDTFFRKDLAPPPNIYQSPKIKTTSKPMNLSAFSLDFNDSFATLNNDQMDLSAIIDEMVSRPPHVTELNGKRLRFDELNAEREEIESGTKSEVNGNVEEKENRVVTEVIGIDESIDEFDLLVVKKSAKSRLSQLKTESKRNICSTPVLQRKYTPQDDSDKKVIDDLDLTPVLNKSNNRKQANVVSSFFITNPEDDIDLFEQSINYRDMNELDSDDDEDSSEADSSNILSKEIVQMPNDLDESNEQDTLDRLVGV